MSHQLLATLVKEVDWDGGVIPSACDCNPGFSYGIVNNLFIFHFSFILTCAIQYLSLTYFLYCIYAFTYLFAYWFIHSHLLIKY